MNSQLNTTKLVMHRGHEVVIATYGDPIVNIALECEDCNEVLADTDINKPLGQYLKEEAK